MPPKRVSKPGQTRRRTGEHVVVAPKGRRDAVLEVIGAARKRLILSVFRCDDFAILDGLADALRRKVRVEVLLTPRAKGWERRLKDLWDVLEGMGATLHRYADPVVKYHAKYIVADKGPALVASLNLTRKCLTGTVDFIVTTRNRAVVSGLTRLFDADRENPGGALPRGLSPRLIIGPERARQQFTALIEQAKRSIRLIDPKVTDPAIVALLKARKAAGVKVTVLGRGSIGGLASHGKLLVIDGKIAVIGSVSLSALSLDFRREVAIVVTDPEAVNTLNTFFQQHASRGQRRARVS
jgi:cardiolipin synthase